MIKYRVWEVINDISKLDYGIIEGNSKIELALALTKLRRKYNIDLDKVKLEYIEGQIDKK